MKYSNLVALIAVDDRDDNPRSGREAAVAVSFSCFTLLP